MARTVGRNWKELLPPSMSGSVKSSSRPGVPLDTDTTQNRYPMILSFLLVGPNLSWEKMLPFRIIWPTSGCRGSAVDQCDSERDAGVTDGV